MSPSHPGTGTRLLSTSNKVNSNVFSPHKLKAFEEYRRMKELISPKAEAPTGVTRQLDRRNPGYEKPHPWPVPVTNEKYNPEDIPKSLPYHGGMQPTLGDMRDKMRLNSIQHKDYLPELDPGAMRARYGDGVYDPDYNIYDPAVEDQDLNDILVPHA
jgi:hypothetical protein